MSAATLQISETIDESLHRRCQGQTKHHTQCKKHACANDNYCTQHRNMYRLEQPADCCICTEPMQGQIRPTKCGHYMHESCLQQWLSSHISCPVCRQTLKATSRETVPTITLTFHDEQGPRSIDDVLDNTVNHVMNAFFSFIQSLITRQTSETT